MYTYINTRGVSCSKTRANFKTITCDKLATDKQKQLWQILSGSDCVELLQTIKLGRRCMTPFRWPKMSWQKLYNVSRDLIFECTWDKWANARFYAPFLSQRIRTLSSLRAMYVLKVDAEKSETLEQISSLVKNIAQELKSRKERWEKQHSGVVAQGIVCFDQCEGEKWTWVGDEDASQQDDAWSLHRDKLILPKRPVYVPKWSIYMKRCRTRNRKVSYLCSLYHLFVPSKARWYP